MPGARISTSLASLCAYDVRIRGKTQADTPPRSPHGVGVVMLYAPRAVPAGEVKVSIKYMPDVGHSSASRITLSPPLNTSFSLTGCT